MEGQNETREKEQEAEEYYTKEPSSEIPFRSFKSEWLI
jgi:hypothetical protein